MIIDYDDYYVSLLNYYSWWICQNLFSLLNDRTAALVQLQAQGRSSGERDRAWEWAWSMPGMIAPQTGHDLTPINREEAARLRDLHINCSEANLREVKKYAVHYPHLFQVADVVGNTALHYASMSRRSDFVEEVLNIYRDSRTFLHFKVEFRRHEEVEGLLFSEGGPRAAAAFVVSRFSDKKHGRCWY